MLRALVLAVVVVGVLSQVEPPVWPEVFQESFVESYNFTHLIISGRFYFDSKRQMMRIDRLDGQHDIFCSSVLPNMSSPCTHLIREGKRYIIHPQRRTCCMCCDQAHGCGILKRDWLSTAKYEGEEDLLGQSFYKWSILDGNVTENYYATKSEARIPRRLNTTALTQDYIVNSYSTDPLGDNVFILPDYCTRTCPATTICGKFQAILQQE